MRRIEEMEASGTAVYYNDMFSGFSSQYAAYLPLKTVLRMRFSILASGSGGNAFYVETDCARILIDAGLSCREIERRLEKVGVEAKGLDALVITHEHIDHIRGAGPLARRFGVPIYINRKTYEKGVKFLGDIASTMIVQTGQAIEIHDLTIKTFTKCHDAVDPFGIVLSCNGVSIGLATDLGRSTGLVEDSLKGCNALVMEFNYDPIMLRQGPYPLDVKRRIEGQDGHLSNQQAGNLLRAVSHEKLKILVLAHLSKTNNHPGKAYKAAADILEHCGLRGIKILTGDQDEPGPLIELV